MAGQNEVPTSVDVNLETGAPPCTSVLRLFVLFSYIGLSSFGGAVPAWMHRAFVERRAWLDEREFSAALALARIVPGVNVVNLAVLLGNRLRGNRGATAAVTGLLLGPSGLRLTEDSHRYRCIRGILAAPPVAFVRVAPLAWSPSVWRFSIVNSQAPCCFTRCFQELPPPLGIRTCPRPEC